MLENHHWPHLIKTGGKQTVFTGNNDTTYRHAPRSWGDALPSAGDWAVPKSAVEGMGTGAKPLPCPGTKSFRELFRVLP